MKKVYTRLPILTIMLSLVILTVIFVATQPRIQAYIPGHSAQSLASFITTIEDQKNVDPKAYWQFREFYSLGSFSFDPRVVTFGETQIISALPDNQTILLKYDSPKLQSVDYIVKRDPSLSEAQQMKVVAVTTAAEQTQPAKVLFTNDTTFLQQDPQGNYVLVFAKSIADMRTANGFFNYTPDEQKLLQNTFWLNVTHIE